MSVVGFDFGTTNSLISVVVGGRAVNFLDDEGMPVPSVVSYEGGRTVVGKEAKQKLAGAGLGVVGSTVRSAKLLLGKESVFVDGVERKPVEIVRDVVTHVVREASRGRRGKDLGPVKSAVVTIPVVMEGYRRAALRDAFRMAGIGIKQFVHEPLAALYAYLRSTGEIEEMCRRFDRQLLLVVDWGGGTLDVTLCRLADGMIFQLANDGSDQLGGDLFDEALRNAVVDRVLARRGLSNTASVHPDAMTRLLHTCERTKIDLSTRDSAVVYLSSFFREGETDLEDKVTRTDLERVVAPLLDQGIARIMGLLDRAGVAPVQIAQCLAVGGMANMPAVKSRLHEIFGVQRVHISDRSASLIAEGAAWIASDNIRLHLAKEVELVLARNSYLPLVRAGTAMPTEGDVCLEKFHLYCVDPGDGFAKFQLQAPVRPGAKVLQGDPRIPLCSLAVRVDSRARPFHERLELDVQIDDNLILRPRARSLEVGDMAEAEVHNLEFAISLPVLPPSKGKAEQEIVGAPAHGTPHQRGALTIRANVADRQNRSLVPGEVMQRFDPTYFDVRHHPPEEQVMEKLYYEPCLGCGRASSDPLCDCGVEGSPSRPTL